MNETNLTSILKRLLRVKYLAQDAKAEIRLMLELHQSGQCRLDRWSPIALLYPFLVNAHSRAGGIFRACLRGYSGDLLQRINQMADDEWKGCCLDESEPRVPYPLVKGSIRRTSKYLGRPLSSGDLLNALMIYPMDPSDSAADAAIDRKIFQALRYKQVLPKETIHRGFTKLALFLEQRGVDPTYVAMRLSGYGPLEQDSDSLQERFSLAIRMLDTGRMRVEVVEQWGHQEVTEDGLLVPCRHGLWLPENVLFLPEEVEEFEKLINYSRPVAEEAFQEFFEAHPKWLYLLGETYETFKAQVSLPPIVLRPELTLVDGAVDTAGMRPDFMLKRVGMDLWDVLDIKRPSSSIAVGRTSRRRYSQAVADAIAQLREYRNRLQDRSIRAFLRQKHHIMVAQPLCMILIGRDKGFKSMREKASLRQQEGIQIYTYDDLHRLARHRMLTL